jgi:hypothetical protein
MLEAHPICHFLTELRTWCVDYKTLDLALQRMAWNEDVQLWRTPNGIFLAPSDKLTLGSIYVHTSFNGLRAMC